VSILDYLKDYNLWIFSGLVFLASWVVYRTLFDVRDYKEVGGKLYVKHGKLGHWVEVEEHMKEGHKK